jgi:hypothetical protein
LKIDKVRIGIAVLVVALIFSILTLVFWGFVRDTIIIPVYYFLWISGLVLNSIPQAIFAVLLAIIGTLIGASTLRNLPRATDVSTAPPPAAQIETRYQHWRRLADNLTVSRFSRNLFMNDARRLILSILAYEYSLDTAEVSAAIKAGTLDLPVNIQPLFQRIEQEEAAPARRGENLLRRLRQLLRRNERPSQAVDPLVAEVMGFIDQHLETTHVGSTSES